LRSGKHGAVIASKDNFQGGGLEYEIPGRKDAGYLVVRAFGANDDPRGDPDHVRNLVVSNAVYLWPQGFQVKAARTACAFHIEAQSKWNGGTLEFQTADGQFIRREQIRPGVITGVVPANARILLSKQGLKPRMFYIAMENAEVEKNLSYLVYGEFRKDYPGLKKGMVPPQAFHLADLRRALSSFSYELK
jgi:hypothetical protein